MKHLQSKSLNFPASSLKLKHSVQVLQGTLVAFFILLTSLVNAQFTSGNLALLVAANNGSNNTTGSIVQINTTALGQTAITTNPIDGLTAPDHMRFSGSATSTGYLTTSSDGSLLCFTGHRTLNTVPNLNTIQTKAVGTLNASGTFSLPATYTGTSTNQTRGATSLNNTNFYIGDQGGLYTNGAIAASPSGNQRAQKPFGGVVYGMVSTTSAFPVGTYSAITGGTYNVLTGPNLATAPSDFFMISSGANGATFDVMYFISNSSATAGVIRKYSLVAGTWTDNGSFVTTFGGFAIAAKQSGTGAELYVTTGTGATAANAVRKLTDANGFNSTISLTDNGALFTTTGTNTIKGISFAPTSPNPTIVLSSPSQIGSGNVAQGASDFVVSQFQAAVSTSFATLNSLSCAVAGTLASGTADLSNLKLWYNTSNTFTGAVQIGSTLTGNGANTYNFTGLTQAISSGSTGYFFITASINAGATAGNDLNIAASPTLTFAAGTPTGTITAGGSQTIQTATPVISIANGTIAAGNISQNSINNVLYRADVTVSVTGAVLNGASFTTAGTYVAADLVNLKLWYSTNATFSVGTSTLLQTKTAGLGAGTQSFGAGGQTFGVGTAYLYVTCDLTCTSTVSSNIQVAAISNPATQFVFATGTATGSGYTAGGLQTFIAGVSAPVNATAATAGGNGTSGVISVAWTNPTGCYDEVMIVAAPAANTGTPTGNGSAYSANSVYGSGTALGNGWVVYKGATSPQNFSGFVNGTTYSFKIFTRYNSTWSAGVEVSGAPFINIPSTDVVVPQFMQGLNGTNTNRVPSSFRMTLSGLSANTTYRYFNQVVIATDAPSSNGAGNPIFVTAGSFFGTSSPSFATPGTTCGTFTTDGSGVYTGWFAVEPTGNATRFIPGNQVFMRININDGGTGTAVVHRATSTNFATVRNLGTTPSDATGIRGTSGAAPRDFICLYDNTNGTGRPLSCNYVESDGYGNVASHAAFYLTPNVEGQNGAWGTIVPNSLANGVRRIESRSRATGGVICFYNGDGAGNFGAVNTVNPAGGTTALVILSANAPMDCSNLTLDHTNIAQTTSILQGINTNDNVLSNFRINTTNNSTTLNSISFTVGGTFNAGDVTNFKLYTNTTNAFPGGAALSTVSAVSMSGGATVTFSALAQALAIGERFFWITGDYSAAGTGNTVSVPALSNGAFGLATNGFITANSILAGGTMTLGTPVPDILLGGGSVSASLLTGDATAVLYRASLDVSVTTAQLTSATFTTQGAYAATDISDLRLYFQTSPTFNAGTATLLGTLTTSLGAGTHTFSPLNQLVSVGTGHLFLTANVLCAANIGADITVAAITTADLTFTITGSYTGSGTNSGSQYVTASVPANAGVISTSALPTGASGQIQFTWTAPTGCYDEVLIVAAPAPNTGVPTGFGNLYTANAAYGSGTALGNGFVVFKGLTSPQTFTGMNNGSTYYFKVFTRNGSSWSSGAEDDGIPTLIPAMTEVVMPQFIQGLNGTNTNRIPFAYRVTINNLNPSALYRYYNGVILTSESSTSNGAGNIIYTNTTPSWTRTSSPGLSAAGTYGEFTSDSTGSYTGWFITEPSGNATRFVPGSQLYMRIMLNDGAGGTAVANRVTSSSIVTVVNTVNAAGATNGSVLRSASTFATAQNFVCVYDNTLGTGRPLSATFVESDGTANTSANSYNGDYSTNVNGVTGSWGLIIPNTLPNGVQRIEQRDFATGAVVGCVATDSDGIWPTGGAQANTVNPTSGPTAKVIAALDAPLFPTTPTWVLDADNDGFYVTGTETVGCTSPGAGYNTTATTSGDCDDSDPLIWQSNTFYTDVDTDGYHGTSAIICYGSVTPPGSLTTLGLDCDDNNIAINPATIEICDNLIDDNCSGQIDENCNSVFPNDSPNNAVNIAFSTNVVYPNCFAISGTTIGAANSPQSATFTGNDVWYKFTAQSTAVSITLSSANQDDAIALYQQTGPTTYTLMPGGTENASSGNSDFERLNYSGLTVGQVYHVSVGAVNASSSGAFQLCIQHLMPSGCASTQPVVGFNLCNNYKAIFRGSAGSGVTYDFDFTGVGGGASGTTSLSATNGLISLSNNALGLRYGGIYNVQVDVNYNLLPSTGPAELITIPGSILSNNCSNVTMRNQPMFEVRSSQRCNATLLRSNFLIGNTVSGDPLACGVLNYTYEFTQVVSCLDGTGAGAPVEYTTPSANPFLPLGVLPNLANVGAWNVRIRPNFNYGVGSYGPTQRISVANSSAVSELASSNVNDDMERMADITTNVSLYPNPNDGSMMNINLTDLTKGDVWVRITDSFGRMVYQNRYTAEESLNTVVVFDQPLASGVYMVEFRNAESIMVERLVVRK
jgi:hypothetical protein